MWQATNVHVNSKQNDDQTRYDHWPDIVWKNGQKDKRINAAAENLNHPRDYTVRRE